MEAGAIHPLTGPVFVKGARPGDVLEIEFLDIMPQPHAFTAIVPGLGFLRDVFTTWSTCRTTSCRPCFPKPSSGGDRRELALGPVPRPG